MKWPWQRVILPNRPTLTLLDDMTIVGLPSDVTQAEAEHIYEGLREWTNGDEWSRKHKPLVLPFPVDVIDRRTPMRTEA